MLVFYRWNVALYFSKKRLWRFFISFIQFFFPSICALWNYLEVYVSIHSNGVIFILARRVNLILEQRVKFVWFRGDLNWISQLSKNTNLFINADLGHTIATSESDSKEKLIAELSIGYNLFRIGKLSIVPAII